MIKLGITLVAATLLAFGVGSNALSSGSAQDCELVIVKQAGKLIEVVRCDDGSSFELAQERPSVTKVREP